MIFAHITGCSVSMHCEMWSEPWTSSASRKSGLSTYPFQLNMNIEHRRYCSYAPSSLKSCLCWQVVLVLKSSMSDPSVQYEYDWWLSMFFTDKMKRKKFNFSTDRLDSDLEDGLLCLVHPSPSCSILWYFMDISFVLLLLEL